MAKVRYLMMSDTVYGLFAQLGIPAPDYILYSDGTTKMVEESVYWSKIDALSSAMDALWDDDIEGNELDDSYYDIIYASVNGHYWSTEGHFWS